MEGVDRDIKYGRGKKSPLQSCVITSQINWSLAGSCQNLRL